MNIQRAAARRTVLTAITLAWAASMGVSNAAMDDQALAGAAGRASDIVAAMRAQISAQPPAPAAAAPPAKPILGIDISHNNYLKNIQWSQIKSDGYSFVYVKATEGVTYRDPSFVSNWTGALAAGLRVGAYHFYSFCDNSLDQAQNYIKTVPVVAHALPPVIDIEPSDACDTLPDKETFLREIDAFAQKVAAVYGKTPMLYVNRSVYAQYLSDQAKYKIWIADPNDTPPANVPNWTLWQRTWTGHVESIGGNVDIDLYAGHKPASGRPSS